MLRNFSWLLGKRGLVTARPLPIPLQGILHVVAIYVVARSIVPLLVGRISPQYFSHMVLFCFVTGFAAGFINGRLWRHSVARFVWIWPLFLLGLAFPISGHGAMLSQSDWGQAFRFYFTAVDLQSGGFTGPNAVSFTSRLFQIDQQYRFVVPASVGIAYSAGAMLSGLLKIPIPELCFEKEASAPTPKS
jgi:hypothetical protein